MVVSGLTEVRVFRVQMHSKLSYFLNSFFLEFFCHYLLLLVINYRDCIVNRKKCQENIEKVMIYYDL